MNDQDVAHILTGVGSVAACYLIRQLSKLAVPALKATWRWLCKHSYVHIKVQFDVTLGRPQPQAKAVEPTSKADPEQSAEVRPFTPTECQVTWPTQEDDLGAGAA